MLFGAVRIFTKVDNTGFGSEIMPGETFLVEKYP